MDYNDDVLYCYEIQLEQSVRRKGLGESIFSHNFDFFQTCCEIESTLDNMASSRYIYC